MDNKHAVVIYFAEFFTQRFSGYVSCFYVFDGKSHSIFSNLMLENNSVLDFEVHVTINFAETKVKKKKQNEQI